MNVLVRRMETFLLLIAVCAVWGRADGVRPAPVAVPRCCPAGSSLALQALELATITRLEALAACHQDVAAATWAPRIYAPARKAYLEPGRLPTHWHVADDALPDCVEFRVLREHSAPFALLANNGSLKTIGPQAATLPTDRYCADNNAALACLDELPAGGVAKCCGIGGAFDGTRCVKDAELGARALADIVEVVNGTVPVGGGLPVCNGGHEATYAVAGSLRGSRLIEDGTLELPEGGARVPAGAWCAEALTAEAGRAAGATEESPTVVLACEGAARGLRPKPPLRHTLYGAGLAVGAAFLAATLAAGFAMPAAHHALHWRCQTYYVAALMVGDVLLAITQLTSTDTIPPTLCRALAVCMHFLFLSAFFWLNTMCFNIWWTFRDFRPTSLERGQEVWRLRVYMLYAWGGPLVVAGTAAILDAAPGATLLRPRFGEQRCWFYGDLEILVYFFAPVGVLLLVNLALFISTTRQLTCGLWRRDEVKSTSERAALGRVCAKLVVVMGVTWSADVLSWAIGGPHYVWYATDLLNALQGLLIFLVVGCQRHAWAMVRRWWSRWCGGRAGAGESRRAPNTHSSTHLPSCGESLTHTTNAPPQPTAPTDTPKIPMETVC